MLLFELPVEAVMSPKKSSKVLQLRWTWDQSLLIWLRRDADKNLIFREHEDFTNREKDISDRNVLKQYMWIIENTPESKHRNKNTLVKRIPMLFMGDAKKTRNSVDGRLRQLFQKLEVIIEKSGDKSKELPPKLTWYDPPSSPRGRRKSRKSEDQKLLDLI